MVACLTGGAVTVFMLLLLTGAATAATAAPARVELADVDGFAVSAGPRSRVRAHLPPTMIRTRSDSRASSSLSVETSTMAMPVAGALLDDLVDLGPGTDVDALRRVVEHQHVRAACRSARATSTFCWLPPDRLVIGASVPG